MTDSSDLIVAAATPAGRSAIAVVRLSGPGSIAAAGRNWRGKPLGSLPDGMQSLGRLVDGPGQEGEVIDEVLASVRRAPRSFTGEEMVEISCHGGPLVVRRIIDLFLASGARLAEPGEFTRRAFENGRLDLTEAEAVIDLINASTDLARRAAAAQLSGRLSAQIDLLRQDLIWALAHVEASIDFPEEGIDPDTGAALLDRIAGCQARIKGLLDSERRGRVLRDGFRVAILGPPNAGKSSLLNAFLGYERAIVSAEPGTTRDFIEEVIDLGGVPVRLIDTAGLRGNVGAVEKAGIERSFKLAEIADLVIELHDCSLPPSELPMEALRDIPQERRLLVLNKCDLPPDTAWAAIAAPRISCLSGAGIEALAAVIEREALGRGSPTDSLIAVGARHADALRRALFRLDRAAGELASGEAPEIVAIDLRAALDSAGEVIGAVDVEEVLGSIFSRFCIGK